jgi:hypothetical protein
MSDVGRNGRSFIQIRRSDLDRLAEIAAKDRAQFFAAYPKWAGYYADRYIGSALCQGAALHYVYGKVGVQDFDVYSFFSANPHHPWYAKRNKHVDFGHSRFGQSIDRPDFVGRRVDLFGRGISRLAGESAPLCIRRWLTEGQTESARCLAKKAVIFLDPPESRGDVLWHPPTYLID